MVRTEWLVASVGVLIVAALAYSFLAPNVGYSIPVVTTSNSFVVMTPWTSSPTVIQQACRPPPVGTIPVGDGVILVDEKGGQHFDFTGIETVTALDRTELGFEAILDVDVVSTAGEESRVVLEGPVPTPQNYESKTYLIAPDGTPTQIDSQPTTPEQIQQVPPQQTVPAFVNQAGNEIIVTNADGTTTEIPLDVMNFADVLDAGVTQTPDGTLVVTVAGAIPTEQNYEARTYDIAADGTPTLVSTQPTTYTDIQNAIAAEPQQVVSDPSSNTIYTYDPSQDAVAALDLDTGEASITAVADFPTLLGQSPAEFQVALQDPLRVQDSVQYSAQRIGTSTDVQIIGIVPPNQQVRFDIYAVSEQVDPSQLASPVRTITISNPSNFAYPYQTVISSVAPVDRYTYVQPRLEPAQTEPFQWQQTQTLTLSEVQQDPRAALLQYASQTRVAQPLTNVALTTQLQQQQPTRQSVIQPNTAVNAVTVSQASPYSTAPQSSPVATSPTTVQEASQTCTNAELCANQ